MGRDQGRHPVSGLLGFLRDSWSGSLMVLAGIALLVAEVWLVTIGTPALLVAAMLASTGVPLLVIVRELWEDWA
jgi:hypothetical protein